MVTLKARIYWAQSSGAAHLRVYQTETTAELSNELRQVGTPANFDHATSEWDYPLTAAAVRTLVAIADRMGLQVEWSAELSSFAVEQERLERYEQQVFRWIAPMIQQSNAPLEGYVTQTFGGQMPPMRHQQLAYHWSLRTTGLLLAHDPGLGKTRSAIDAAAGWYRHGIIRPMSQFWNTATQRWCVEGGVLVVCPKAVIRTWSSQAAQWQSMTSVEITGPADRKRKRAGMVSHIHAVNYQSLHSVVGNRYDGLIIDESHRCANKTKQTDAVQSLSLPTKRRLLLTGSPVSNSLESVFFQMLIADGGRTLGCSRAAFLNEYFTEEVGNKGRRKHIPKEDSARRIAQRMAQSTYFLRKEEAIDLPHKLFTPIYLDMTVDQRRYYEELRKEAITYIQDKTVSVPEALSKMHKLLQVCQGVVREEGGEWLSFTNIKQETLLESLTNELYGRKVVVWCRFTHEIDSLLARLSELGIWALRFDGQVSHKNRNQIITAWNTDSRYTVFVAQLSMSEGIELLAKDIEVPCYDCEYLGVDYSFVNWLQSQDRIHRIGQRYPCHYKVYLTSDGIDRGVYESLRAKQQTSDLVYTTGKEYLLQLLRGESTVGSL
jgi:SNF2 family DNA or RNA helicase